MTSQKFILKAGSGFIEPPMDDDRYELDDKVRSLPGSRKRGPIMKVSSLVMKDNKSHSVKPKSMSKIQGHKSQIYDRNKTMKGVKFGDDLQS